MGIPVFIPRGDPKQICKSGLNGLWFYLPPHKICLQLKFFYKFKILDLKNI